MRHNTKWGQYIHAIEENAFHKALRAAQSPSVALEIGTEGGYWTRQLVEYGWKVICTDVDEHALALCRQRVPSATCIHVSPESTTLPCAPETVGLMLCIEVFPVINSGWFLPEATRILRPGGVVIGVAQNKNSIRSVAAKIIHTIDRERNATFDKRYLYTNAYTDWKNQMEHRGLSVIHEEGMCWLPFQRKSDFFLIPQLARLEEQMGLRKMPHLSPWIAFVAQKR
ncbi:MAG: class I SAM-dependent methyltransferase [Bacteroidetes bacterium]|nr:class I SAM-dependent methyltransferase [Bacteroidota bacterium]MCW5894093.1 class I SAM-dependent methyltransferase [Bacteroidota bacterium]